MTLERHLLRQLLAGTALVLVALLVVVVPSLALHAVGRMAGAGLLVVLRYLPLALVDLVPYLLPLAFLVALVGTYARLAAENELLAMRMAGIHPLRVALPALVVALPATWLTHHLVTEVSPRWLMAQRTFRFRVEALDFRGLHPGRTEIEFGEGSLVAQSRAGNRFLDVLALLPDEASGAHTLMADAAALSVEGDDLRIEFEGARFLGGEAQLFGEYPTWTIPIESLYPSEAPPAVRAKYFPSSHLRAALASGEAPAWRVDAWRFELHHRRALSLVYVVFLTLGLPLGLQARAGGRTRGYLLASGLAFVYFAATMQLGRFLLRGGWLGPTAAAWLTTAVFLPLGLWLTRRAFAR